VDNCHTTANASTDPQGERGQAVAGISGSTWRIAGELNALRPREQLLERHAHFEPGQGGAHAEMDTLAPDQTGFGVPLDLDSVWISVYARTLTTNPNSSSSAVDSSARRSPPRRTRGQR